MEPRFAVGVSDVPEGLAALLHGVTWPAGLRPAHPEAVRLLRALGVEGVPEVSRPTSQWVREWAEGQDTETLCGVHGCEWKFSGNMADGRAAFAEHRAKEHPTLVRIEKRRETSRKAKWNRENVIEAMQRWAREHGDAPTANGWRSPGDGYPSYGTVINVFGSFGDALLTAGFELRVMGRQPSAPDTRVWTEEKIVAAIQAWNEEHGRPPSQNDWKRADPEGLRPGSTVVATRFGSFGKALEAAGFQARKRGGQPGNPGRPGPRKKAIAVTDRRAQEQALIRFAREAEDEEGGALKRGDTEVESRDQASWAPRSASASVLDRLTVREVRAEQQRLRLEIEALEIRWRALGQLAVALENLEELAA